ncbi:uncharacterized protein LOC103506161 [Diaphorina citri]|uniref:Uncharacterized protein LOC103506161 n=1 Tax=Diaphorina citri TaxID=121845 RepID=A0A1S3CX08_DIACI|nr:uncharacterized protein LOC103506161 [Diaphorina citri]
MSWKRNVYDPGKTVLAIWTDKIYYPAVIEEDLQSFLRVRYLDGFVKKIIKQQTVPMSVLYEDTPVHVMTEEDDELKPGKLKAFDESQRVCTVEWTEESSLATVNFECLRMFPEHVRVIQNKYTSVLESPKLHQLTLDNILQRKRTPARRHDGHSDGSLSQCSSSSRGNHSSSGLSSSSISSSASKRPRKADKSLSLPENRSESAGGVASARKKKVLEEKVDNTGNRGAKCRQRIFDADTSKGQKKIKSKPPSTKGSKPGAGGTLGPRKSSGKSFLSDSPQPSCSKSTPGERENKFRPTSHVDIDVTEYCPSSDSEHELHSINMEGFDMDFVQPESDCETFAEIVSNRAVDRLCGPIPASGLDLFSGYVFVVSHSNQGLDYGSDGNLSDQQYEALTSKFPFRRRRLEHQLTKGGGTVFPSLNLVPHEKLENTLLITDRPGTTCNFILALAMRVPVLHYYYVIQCCVTKTHIKKHRLPSYVA